MPSQSYADDKPTSKKSEKTPMIDKFGKDLTKLASQGKIDPVIGRLEETKRCCQILSRKKKNNPILIGEAGVGKTNIAQGIANMINSELCPVNLYNKRIISIEMSQLVAGTIYRGQFEERVNDLISEVKQAGDIILFIDEIHTMVGAGNGAGSLDVSNIIKPALADGTLQIIGATTLDEYRQNFENDKALTRRFQSLLIEPTSIPETIEILHRIKGVYQEHHAVEYTDDAIEACVKLSERYITDRVLPDKAIDLLDEAGSATNIVTKKNPIENFKEHEDEIATLRAQKDIALLDENQNYEEAAVLNKKIKEIEAKIAEEKETIKSAARKQKKLVTKDMIAAIVTQMTGVPVHQVGAEDLDKLSKLAEVISKKVIGQEEPINKIVKAIKRSRVGIKNPSRPVSFMFIGNSGIGKTLLAKTVAKELFGSEDAMIRIDMSEFSEKFSVSKLIGAPPGYVGYEKGGKLTEAIRRRPYSVVLLDEVEKAHPDIFDPLLQILDDGHITDSLGRKIDFKNTIIFMTSNIGARTLSNFGTGVGFTTAARFNSTKDDERAILEKELNKFFKPEFLNRLDDMLSFSPLDKKSCIQILEIELNNLSTRMKDVGYIVSYDKNIKEYLIEKGFDEKRGARPLNKAIRAYVEDVITDSIVNREITVGDSITITVKKDVPTVKINNISISTTKIIKI